MDGIANPDTSALQAYLNRLRLLATTVSAGISALASDNLRDLEAVLCSQQGVCAEVQSLKAALPVDTNPSRSETFTTPRFEVIQLLQQISAVQREVCRLNRIYAALLRRSNRLLGIVSAVYESCAPAYKQGYEARRSYSAECQP